MWVWGSLHLHKGEFDLLSGGEKGARLYDDEHDHIKNFIEYDYGYY